MGLSLGGSYGSAQGTESTSGSTSNAYTAGQSGVQSGLADLFSKLLPGMAAGTTTPNVNAMKTASADAINKTSSGLTDRVTRFLAQRGFGSSGETGKATLAGELGRESDLAQNESNYAGVQLGQNTSGLLAALNYAFNSIGANQTGSSSSQSSGYKVGGGFSVGKV